MTASIHTRLLTAAGALWLVLAGIPQYTQAQRFGHSNFGSHPAPAPAYHPAPAPPPRQAPAPAPRPAPEYRPAPSINGGARNIGNHDMGRPQPQVNVNVNVRPGPRVVVPPSRTVTRDHVNVYHTGGYRGIHPYSYHPYRPYYWGPRWHPVGYFLSALAADAFYFSLANQAYYYDDGVYYEPGNGGYTAVPPPIGAVVNALPEGYETTMVGNDTFYYYGGAFYAYTDQGYQVIAAPAGAVITELPQGAVQQDIDGQTYMVYNNVYYAPISQDGQDAYEVVQMDN